MSKLTDRLNEENKKLRAMIANSQMSEPRQDKTTAPKNQNATAKETGQNPTSRNPLASFDPFHLKPCPIYVECPKTEKKYSFKWFKTRIEVVGIVVGVFVAALIYLQYGEMAKTTQVLNDQLKAMQGQVNEMQKSRAQAERAWVLPTGTFSERLNDRQDSSIFMFPIKNTGKTPALNVRCFMGWRPDTNSIPKDDRSLGSPMNSGVIAPESEALIPSAPVPGQLVIGIDNGTPIYIIGTIWYDDIFRKHHWIQFCYQMAHFEGGTNFIQSIPCAFHNSCDDDGSNQQK